MKIMIHKIKACLAVLLALAMTATLCPLPVFAASGVMPLLTHTTDKGAEVVSGDTVTFTVNISNKGTEKWNGIVLTSTLDFVDDVTGIIPGYNNTFSSGELEVEVGDLAAGNSKTIEIKAVLNASGASDGNVRYSFNVSGLDAAGNRVSAASASNIILVESARQYTLTYNINNDYHNEYKGVRDTTFSVRYDEGTVVEVGGRSDVFPDYGDTCAFVGWNTATDGSGTDYYDSDFIPMTDDITLYARWKSCTPTHNPPVYEFDVTTSGRGVYGTGDVGATVIAKFSNGAEETTTVQADGSWLIVIPLAAMPMEAGDSITVTQIESNKLESDPITTIIQ